MALGALLAAVFIASTDALKLHRSDNATAVKVVQSSAKVNSTAKSKESHAANPTFQEFYAGHASGRGIWKWNNAIDAYQRHFGGLVGRPLSVAEVGVQSGGSMLMWKAALGSQIKLFGLDINPECKKFEEPGVVITIGDQADYQMWKNFYTKVTPGLDILIDDGGHEAHQMLATLGNSYQHIHPGGYIVIEDIHGAHYLDSFFKPAANFLSQMAQSELVDSVHIYPVLLVVRKAGFAADAPQAQDGVLAWTGAKLQVAELGAMWSAISTAAPGSHIVVQNPSWGTLFTSDALTNFFSSFVSLHDGGFKDTPEGCRTTAAPVCTNEIYPLNWLQTRVSGVHVYKFYVVIEIAAAAPQIAAIRKGTEWITYSGHGAL
jgi:cephalosporin hydroxylase